MLFFEWDEAKAKSNLRKHGIAFEDAAYVFDDPNALFEQDRVVDGEARWLAIGSPEGVSLLYVAYTDEDLGEDSVVRILSARLTTRKERIRYGNSREKNFS